MNDHHETMHHDTADELKSLVARHERLQEEIDGLISDQKDLLSEAKSKGYNTKMIKKAIKILRMDPDKRESEEMELAVYLHALGVQLSMDLGGKPERKSETQRVRELEDA